MKAVLISIQPKWVEKIARGEKTIEVRKSRPKSETPFKCYIYCTKGKDLLREVDNWHTGTKTHTTNYRIINLDYCTNKIANGKVIGEFVCSEIEPFTEYECLYDGHYVEEKTRVSQKELLDYKGKNDFLYGWHISKLKIYDKPKSLSEFTTICRNAYCQDEWGTPTWFCKDGYGSCAVKDKELSYPYNEECQFFDCPSVGGESCEKEDFAYCLCNGRKPITRPPQSWCYVEAQE